MLYSNGLVGDFDIFPQELCDLGSGMLYWLLVGVICVLCTNYSTATFVR